MKRNHSQPGPALLHFLRIFAVLLLPGTVLAAPPANDNFANALVLSGLPVSTDGSNVEATLQANEPDETEGDGGASVWWRWTAPASGWVEINTFGSDFDTVLAVYTGSSLNGLALVGWNDESASNSQSRLKFEAAAGTVYRIQIQGWLFDEGDIALSLLSTTAATPPVLQRLTITPATAEVTAGMATLSAVVEFTAPDTLTGIELTLTSPGGDVFYASGYALYDLSQISGNLEGGVYQFPVIVPASRMGGTWQVAALLWDEAGTKAFYGNPGDPPWPAGSTTSVVLTNSGPVDALPPQIASGTLTPNPVNVTAGSQSVTVRVAASDDRAVSYLSLRCAAPSNAQEIWLGLEDADLVSGSLQSGVWEKTLTIPPFSQPGTWTVSYTVGDGSDRYTDYGDGEEPIPAELPSTLSVQNTGPVDLAGPVLNAISADQTAVDISTGSQEVQINVTLQDSTAGLKEAAIILYGPSGQSVAFGSLYYQVQSPYPTTALNTTATVVIPRYLAPGVYQWQLSAYDSINQSSYYGGTGLAYPGGFAGILTVQNTGPVDSAPPQLVSLAFNPGTVQAAFLPATIHFTAVASDDTGIEQAYALLVTPEGDSYGLFALDLTAGTAGNGTWTGELTVGADYPAGTYFIGVSLRDFSGTYRDFGWRAGFLPLPPGSAPSITVTGGTTDAYSTWRAARPSLAGASGLPAADPEADGLPNAVEFLLGTDPLRDSRPGGADPDASRAPAYSLTSSQLRVEYRLSAANAALGSGNPFSLQPQSSLNLTNPWSPVIPGLVSGDLWRAELPLAAGVRQFLRLAVVP